MSAPHRLASLSTLLLLLALPAAAQAPAGARPNVVLILADDMGYGDLAGTGNPVVRTPSITALAAAGVHVRNFYVSPVCAPTRAALLTGRYPPRTGVVENGAALDPAETTLAEVLAAAGYATGIFGKWHLGDHHPRRPKDRGFQKSLVSRGGIVGQLADTPVEVRYTDPFLMEDGALVQRAGYATDVYFDAALAWIEDVHDGAPFFVYLPTNAPHGPFSDVPAELYEHYAAQELGNARFPDAGHPLPRSTRALRDKLARVYAMVEKIDQNVGRLLLRLAELGIEENTIVLFLSDNGPNGARYNLGMRGTKASVYEGGLRAPLYVSWPGTLPAGTEIDRRAMHVDLFPTVLDLCGVDPPAVDLDGRALAPLLRGETTEWEPRRLFFQANQGDADPRSNFAVLSGRWKLVQTSGYRGDDSARRELEPIFELFDLENDPLELRNERRGNAEIVAELRRAYEREYLPLFTRAQEVRIPIGSPHENPVLFTRDNWKRASWDPDATPWRVRVFQAGRYDVHYRFAPAEERRTAVLRLGQVEQRLSLRKNATSASFEGIELPKGHAKLDAVLEGRPGEQWAVWQVEIERL